MISIYIKVIWLGKKRATVIRVDEEVLKKAKDLGLNISKTCENLLKMEIERLEEFFGRPKHENRSENTDSNFSSRRRVTEARRPVFTKPSNPFTHTRTPLSAERPSLGCSLPGLARFA